MAELLIVDDDPAILRMLRRTLAAEGYVVRVAADGGAALVELERSLPDVLVLDVAMPGLDGLHVAERVRAKGLAVPILFLTARDAVADRVAGFEAGGDDYLVKPFAMAELLVRVRALLRRTRPADRELVHRDLRLDPSARRAVRASPGIGSPNYVCRIGDLRSQPGAQAGSGHPPGLHPAEPFAIDS